MPLTEEHAALIPEDIRSDPSLQSFNDVGSIAKSYLETKSMVGRSIQLPNGESKPEDFDKWASEQSVKLKDKGYAISKYDPAPEKPDGYKFTVEGKSDEEVNADKGVQIWRKIAHEHGLSNKVANEIMNKWGKEFAPMFAEGLPKAPEFIEGDGLKPMLEKEFPGHSVNIVRQEFESGLKQLSADLPGLPDVLSEAVVEVPGGKFVALRDHPVMMRLVTDVAKLKAQDFGGNIEGLTSADTFESVDREITDMRANKDLSQDEIGKRLEVLYKKKSALMRMKKAS